MNGAAPSVAPRGELTSLRGPPASGRRVVRLEHDELIVVAVLALEVDQNDALLSIEDVRDMRPADEQGPAPSTDGVE